MFRSLEIYRLRAEWREQERQRKEADRRRRWEAAMERARLRYEQHVRWEHFKKRSHDWQAIRQYREFLAAVKSVADTLDASRQADLAVQLDLAERALDEIDAIRHPELLVANVPDPKPDDLEPFLDGWSPYGPNGRGW